MINCPACNHPNSDGLTVCDRCGASLSIANALELASDACDLITTPVNVVPHLAATDSDGGGHPDCNLPSTLKLNSVPLVETTNKDAIEVSVPKPAGGVMPVIQGFGEMVPDEMHPEFPPEARTHRLSEASGGDARAKASLPSPETPTKPPLTMAVSAIGSATHTPVTTPPPAVAQPKLIVLRGERVNVQYPIYEGKNFIGRTDEKPVDIDLENQEPPDRIWTSRQHAVITFEKGAMFIEDLNSLNGTFVNRTRVHPGQQRVLQVNDVVQVGTVQLKVILV